MRGSSPLARGLREAFINLTSWVRIIPARAGFTPFLLCGKPRQEDHPRSRGVYTVPPGTSTARLGSSPLARGLPMTVAVLESKDGIIPARAGFTKHLWSGPQITTDHPRSRGVYSNRYSKEIADLGSSPLAQGLLLRRGIILRARSDHPRSRGVYFMAKLWSFAI